MFSKILSSMQRQHRGRGMLWLLAIWLQTAGGVLAADNAGKAARAISPTVVTSFEQIWHMTESETKEWHRLRMEYVVYYYDPLWQAMWGRCGEADSYLSIGSKPFPIQPGQKILVEGLILPVKGMNVDEPKVTVLAESAPVEVLPTLGEIGNTQRFNKHLVTVEGYVDRQVARDANHQELDLIVEGNSVLVQFLVRSGETTTQMTGSLVRVQGVYFARSEPTWTAAKLEIWVPGLTSIEVIGQLNRDGRFDLPATPANLLSAVPSDKLVRVEGVVQKQEPGKSLTIRDKTGVITFPTAQALPMAVDQQVEAIGFALLQGKEWSLSQVLYRREQLLLTSYDQLLNVPDALKNEVHRVRLDFVVHFFDPHWKVAWGRSDGVDVYLSLGEQPVLLKPGQHVQIEGLFVPAKGMVIEEPRITLLGESGPLEALPTRGQIGNTERFDKHLVMVEGYVDRQVLSDSHHLEIDLVAEGRTVMGRLLLNNEAAAPQVEGALVQLTGVYSATNDPNGVLPNLELWVQGEQNIKVKGWLAQDKQFELPATAIENLAAVAADKLVRIVGVVRAQQPGKSLTIRDETGQLILLTAQTRVVPLGERVEAIGYPKLEGMEWRLRETLYRRIQTAGAAPVSANRSLRLAEQLRELPPEEATRGYPVQLTGVVTWENRAADFFFLQDPSGGVCVFHPPERIAGITMGSSVSLTGVSASGKFTPVVLATSAKITATIELPEAKQVSLEQALTGIEEAQWVTMSGYVRSVTHDGLWARLELTTGAGEFTALLPWNDQLMKFRHSVVRMRGVCSALTNGKRQLTDIQLWVRSSRYLEIEEAEPADPFTVTARSITSLRQFNSLQASNRRVRVAGVVVQHTPGHVLHIQEGTEAVLVLSSELAALLPGDRVEVVGFPGRESSRVVLREAVYRRVASGAEPIPVEIPVFNPSNVELDGRLVHIEAMLLDLGAQEKGTRLILQANGVIFEALLDAEKSSVPDDWVAGSRLALTGVYQVQFDENKRPHAVQVQLRSLRDVQVLQRPSWWTGRHMLAVTGVLIIAILLGLAWVIALRRQVRQQTVQIRAQIDMEKAARLDAALVRASKLESLGLLAGGIAHDFNNLLTVIMGNLSLVRLIQRLDPESTRCLQESERAAQRARDLTQQLLTFAKGGAPVREAVPLADVVREAVEFGLHGSKVRGDLTIPPGLWAADVDKGQIGQVVHNIVINAIQAMPEGGVLDVKLANEEIGPGVLSALAAGRYVKLLIADTGVGISPESLPRIFEPYFTTKKQGSGLGLATVYSIIKKHDGHIEVASKVGQGATFSIWLPAATGPVVPLSTEPLRRQTQTGRVLLMDDEAPIRLMTDMLLKRQGFEVTAVAEGAEAVREYRTALESGRPFELVILDLTVPGGMGGSETMERIREMDPDVCAIVSSGYSNDPVMADYAAHGFRGMVAKPFEVEALLKTINAILPHRATLAGSGEVR